ncbi:UDP-N-acetylmuramate dehydrogenase [Aestuariibacter sp. AA17]|uniref:UDP-N-acetylenolpyruvoylglucosamine reductase n=1 Tax=Fluctibacter corallii TaxID=2984329 RepID=A0ABT3ADG0_9ALTE|nr:UDP-N-acetylmuramate dehydrogenase [Aestuariibacter sp. AA17]MCV2886678.1 UDP-N-acetylmuramate dehydrogenase [Aestuariibacter sp. AA17]
MPSLTPFHTFGLSAECPQIITVTSIHQLKTVLAKHADNAILLGEGSNCIFIEDINVPVIVIQTKGIEHERVSDGIIVRAQAGENWHQFVTHCLHHGWHGLENLALIPGTVGAAPIQNIGAYGVEVAQFIHQVHVLDRFTLEAFVLEAKACEFGYRESVFKQVHGRHLVVTQVDFHLPSEWAPNAQYAELRALSSPSADAIYHEVIKIRTRKLPDPNVDGNAGSFFKNPVISEALFTRLQQEYGLIAGFKQQDGIKIPAAWLIDKLGFKGKATGGIRCHPNQPLVLSNFQHGTGSELLMLAREIKQAVEKEFSIVLENEVRLIGKEGLIAL